jgi:hypothetical protein
MRSWVTALFTTFFFFLYVYIRSRSFLLLVRWLFRERKVWLSSLSRSFLHVGSPILSMCTSIHFRSSSSYVFDKKEIIKIRKIHKK